MSSIVIVGCGGHAKSIIDILEQEGKYNIVGFVDKEKNTDYSYRGYKIVGADENLKRLYLEGVRNAVIGIGYLGKNNLRDKIYKCLKDIGYKLPTIIDPTAAISDDARIEEGTVVGKKAVVNADVKIGKMAIINSGAIIEHECKIGDFSHVAVGGILCGNVTVGNHTFVGAGATVIQGVEIGNECIVGAGSTILSNVEDGLKVYGVV